MFLYTCGGSGAPLEESSKSQKNIQNRVAMARHGPILRQHGGGAELLEAYELGDLEMPPGEDDEFVDIDSRDSDQERDSSDEEDVPTLVKVTEVEEEEPELIS